MSCHQTKIKVNIAARASCQRWKHSQRAELSSAKRKIGKLHREALLSATRAFLFAAA